MKKTRVILALVGLSSLIIFAFGVYYGAWLWSPTETGLLNAAKNVTLILALALTPFTFLASSTMFGFSFFRVRELPDGRLSYDPSSPYWKLMRKIFDFEEISLCVAFWLTALAMFVASAGTFLIFLFSLFIWSAYANGVPKDFWPTLLYALLKGGSWLSALGLSLFLMIKLGNLRKTGKRGVKILCDFLTWSLFAAWFVVIPFVVMIYKYNYNFTESIMQYLKGAGIFVGFAAAAFSVVFVILYISNFQDDNLLKRFWRAFKKEYCPILVSDSAENKS